MTTSAREPMFSKKSQSHLAKDAAIVTLAGLIVAGFLAHAWRPQAEPAALKPAVFLAQR